MTLISNKKVMAMMMTRLPAEYDGDDDGDDVDDDDDDDDDDDKAAC